MGAQTEKVVTGERGDEIKGRKTISPEITVEREEGGAP